MKIPLFPAFHDIDLSFQEEISRIISENPLEASEYTFVNLFAFREAYRFKVSRLGNNLVILSAKEPVSMFCPVGSDRVPDALKEAFGYLKTVTSQPVLERVPQSFVDRYIRSDGRFTFAEERDHFDYCYEAADLIELKGNRFHDKKNNVNHFMKNYQYEYLKLTRELVRECIEFEDHWCQVKECEKTPGLENERKAILEMLRNFSSLRLQGGVIKVDGNVAALALGESLLTDTFVVHVEKANQDIRGLYQTINREFLMNGAAAYPYVNREQDLGVEGLRRAKLSYHPRNFIKKYRVGIS